MLIVKHGDAIPRFEASDLRNLGGFAGGGGILVAGDSAIAFDSSFSFDGDGGVHPPETSRGLVSTSGSSDADDVCGVLLIESITM